LSVIRFITTFLGGKIPGGPWLLLILLGLFSITLWFVVRTSGMLEPWRVRQILVQGWATLIVGYFILWSVTKPESLPPTLLVTPFVDQTNEGWIGEALADCIGERLAFVGSDVHWIPWEVCPPLESELSVDSVWVQVKKMQPAFAVWGSVRGRADSMRVELHSARTSWGRTVRFSPVKRLFRSFDEAAASVVELTRTTTRIPWHAGKSPSITDRSIKALEKYYGARRQLRKGKWESAQQLAAQAIAIDSTWSEPWSLKAISIEHSDNAPEQAVIAYTKALELDSTNISNWRHYVSYAIRGHHWDLADSCLRAAYRLQRKNPVTLFLLSHLRESRVQSIANMTPEQALELALRLHPGYLDVRLKLARDYYDHGNLRKCRMTVRDGLDLYPTSWELWELLSNVSVREKKFNTARIAIRRSMQLGGDRPSIWYNAGLVYFYLDSLSQAMTFLSRSVAVSGSSNGYYLLGRCAERQGDSTAAIEYYRQCVDWSTGDSDVAAEEARRKIGIVSRK